jgi:LCCL domain
MLKRRRHLAAALAAIALLLLGGAGWYAHGIFDGRGSAPGTASVEPGAGPGAPPDADAGSPGAAPPTQPQVANLPSTDPVSDLGPCPQMLMINPNLPTPFTCTCGSDAVHAPGAVWGTDIYTGDSSLCLAALHAGVMGVDGGSVTVLRSEGRQIYIGSTRNGVASHDFGRYVTSITFDGVAARSAPEPCPQMLAINRDLPTPFQCTCGPGAATLNGAVWGTDVYTDDSTLCLAAVHAGAIGPQGGLITVLRSEGRPLYVGSARNGVTTHDFGSYAASIRFEQPNR